MFKEGTVILCKERLHKWLEPRIWRPEAHVSDYCGEPTRDILKLGDLRSPAASRRAALVIRGEEAIAW